MTVLEFEARIAAPGDRPVAPLPARICIDPPDPPIPPIL